MQECCDETNHFSNQKWNDKYYANYEYLQDDFTDQLDYKLHTIQSEDMF